MKFFKGNERTSSFKILTSSDNINFVDVTGVLTSSGTTLDYEQFDFASPFLNTQYFRIQGLGNSGPAPNNVFNSYVEVEIIGNPVDCNVLSVDELNKEAITMYPIPVTQGELTIKSSQNINTIDIYSISGKLLKTSKKASKNIKLNLTNFSSGIYFIRINKTVTRKLIID